MNHHHLLHLWLLRYAMASLLCVLVFTCSALIGTADTGFDFDGDNRADLSVFRPQTGDWYVNNTNQGFSAFHFGQDGDIPVARDYDGDGKADAAVYRSGVWYRLKSSTNTWDAIPFGLVDDVPSPADFDGDRKSDIAVFRPSTGEWHRLLSLTNNSYSVSKFGQNGDQPVAADFDGDQRADIAVFRPQNGTWHQLSSASGNSYLVRQFGLSGDIPLTADFDGDSKSDLAVWRPSNCHWYIMNGLGSTSTVHFGISTDSPVPADYDGDGRSDISIFRPNGGYWYRINSASLTVHVEQFGLPLDIPVPEFRRPRNPPNPTPTPTPTPSPTATPTPTPTPSPTPTPPASFTCDYYASTTGSSSGTGSIASPWDLQSALNKTTLVTNGKTLCLRGGTYAGKFKSQLSVAIVRSAPGEWARIDGYKTTTLPSAITAAQTTFAVQSTSGLLDGGSDELVLGGEVIKVFGKNGNNITGSLRGASNSLNGAEPHAAGSTVILGGDALYVSGSVTTYRDFEILNSRPSRDGNTENQGIGRGNGVTVVGTGNKFVNLIIHDNLSGVMTSGASSSTEIYGCLIYNNGMHAQSDGTEQGLGHGMYLENSSGFSKVYEDIVFNNFNLGMQGYGVTAPYVGGDISGTVISNSGSPLGKFGDVNRRNYNLILGPDSQISPTAVLRDSHFFHPMSTSGYSVKFGYGAGVGVGTITGNYFVGGGTLFEIANTPSANVSGNQFYSSRSGAVYVITENGRPYAWTSNVYHSSSSRDVFGVAATGIYQYAGWRSLTGFDQAGSSATTTAMPTTVIVRPNAYKAGRANVLIYSSSATATINLSLTGLVNGQGYTIRNAQDYFGAAIASGTYSAQSPNVVVSISGPALTVAAPSGYSFTPATTCPQFCPMVVVPN